MSKPKRERPLTATEARARTTTIRISPQKLNLVAQMIRGKKVSTALADLTFSRKRIAKDVKRTLESAVANAENNHQLDVDSLVVAEAHVGKVVEGIAEDIEIRGVANAGNLMIDEQGTGIRDERFRVAEIGRAHV